MVWAWIIFSRLPHPPIIPPKNPRFGMMSKNKSDEGLEGESVVRRSGVELEWQAGLIL